MWEQTSTIYLENRLTDIKLAQGSKDVGKRVANNQQKIFYIRETIPFISPVPPLYHDWLRCLN